MDLINAAGQRVSLLNNEEPAHYFHKRPQLSSQHSRNSSYSTSYTSRDADSPQFSHLASPISPATTTPQLVRHHSSASQVSLNTPSPMTPTYPFEPLDQSKSAPPSDSYYRPNGPYYVPQPNPPGMQPPYSIVTRNDLLMDDPYAAFPTTASQFPFATDLITPITPQSALALPLNPSSAAQSESSSTAANAGSSKQIKKKYPCPHAARFSCADTFTTSGHAARHGKKHTGEKNIHCPTCNKAFTRKDNMKQHERTHRSNKDSTPGSAQDLGPASPLSKSGMSSASRMDVDYDDDTFTGDATVRPHRTVKQKSNASDAFQYHSVDASLADDSRPGYDRKYTGGSQDGEGESPGLDALAMAASGMSG